MLEAFLFQLVSDFSFSFLFQTLYSASSIPPSSPIIKAEDPDATEHDDILQQTYNDIENYTDNFNMVKLNLMTIRNGLDSARVKLTRQTNSFVDKIVSYPHLFKEEPKGYYNEHDCRRNNRNCRQIVEECSQNLLNQTEYIKSINSFKELFSIEYNDLINHFDRELDELRIQMVATKMLAYVNYAKNQLNGTELTKTIMGDWQKEKFTELDIKKKNVLDKIEEFIETFTKLSARERKFENAIIQEIKETKLSFACCLKKFNFQVEGLECDLESEKHSSLTTMPSFHPPPTPPRGYPYRDRDYPYRDRDYPHRDRDYPFDA